jgi:hypothetical protein
MTDFYDHNGEARGAFLKRSIYVGNPENRDKHNALTFQAALNEARRIMAGNNYLELIEEVLFEKIHDEICNYVATYIPKALGKGSCPDLDGDNGKSSHCIPCLV